MNPSTRLPLVALATLLIAGTLAGGCGSLGRPNVIYLARHGQTEWNRVSRLQGDPDLDSVGYINRASLWMLLRHEPIVEIYTSAARRTQRTAQLIAREKGLPIRAWPALNEIQPGVLTGICYAALAPDEPHSKAARECVVDAKGSRPQVILPELRKLTDRAFNTTSLDRVLPQGESYRDVMTRTAPFVEHLDRRRRDSAVLIVAHGVTNRVLLHRLLGWSMPQVRGLCQENDQVYRMEHAGTPAQKVSLYTPGVGWKACSPPRPGDKRLDCAPEPKTTPASALMGHRPAASPAPKPAPAASPEPAASQPAL